MPAATLTFPVVSENGRAQVKFLLDEVLVGLDAAVPEYLRASELLSLAGKLCESLAALQSEARPIDAALLEGLSAPQQEFLKLVPANTANDMATILKQSAPCGIGLQTELSDAPPFCLYVMDDPEFWVECFDSVADAHQTAQLLNLPVVKVDVTGPGY